MLRKMLTGVVVFVLFVGVALAAEIKAVVKSVDADKSTITVTVDDKDQTIKVDKDVKVAVGKKAKELKDLKEGQKVLLITDGEGDKAVVKEIKSQPK